MKFYVLTEPYYALIVAKDKEECFEVYTEAVSKVQDNLGVKLFGSFF